MKFNICIGFVHMFCIFLFVPIASGAETAKYLLIVGNQKKRKSPVLRCYLFENGQQNSAGDQDQCIRQYIGQITEGGS